MKEVIMSIFRRLTAWATETTKAVKEKEKRIDMKQQIDSHEWIAKSKEWLIDQSYQSKQIILQYKKQAILSAVILTVGLSGAGIGHTYYQSNMETIYHVYLHGEKIGVVNDPTIVHRWIDEKIKEESSKFGHITFQKETDLTFEAERIYQAQYNNQQTLEKLQAEFALKADAIKVIVDGQFIGYAANEEVVHTLLDAYKREFVSEDVLATIDSQSSKKVNSVSIASVQNGDSTKEPAKKELDQIQIVDVVIKQKIELETEMVHPNQVLDLDELKAKLSQSRVEKKVHVVKEGDVLGAIAQKYGLTTKELLKLNPEINEKTLLQIGQELVVTQEEPLITVLTVEKISREEKIMYPIKTKSDPNLFRGDTRIEQEGKAGKKIVDYVIIKQNGEVIDKKIEHEEIIVEPEAKIVVRGEKTKPSRGDGQFQWPTKGGFITSGYGQRWGRLHQGIDISGVKDKTILAADNGTVTTAGWHSDYGNYVIIDHDNGYETLYAHLSSISVSKGDVVQKGEAIGVMGTTGRSTGVHLHFEIIKNGSVVNPAGYFRK